MKDKTNRRLNFLMFVFGLLTAGVICRLFFLQIRDYEIYKKIADAQHIKEKVLPATRGRIFLSDGTTIIAENRGLVNVAVAPKEVKNQEEVAQKLSLALGVSKNEILEKIKDKNKLWVIIKNNVLIDKVKEIENLDGVYLESHLDRFYPLGRMASHVVGFYGFDSEGKKKVGQYGVEGFFQEKLAGKDGFMKGVVDANQNPIFSSQNKIQEPINGDDIVLTINPDIQFFIEEKLKETYEKYKPRNATFIVISPKTGEILAMASLPNFDPNEYYKEKDPAVFKNPALVSFEPGSIFKPITAAAGIDAGVITPETTYYDSGKVVIDNFEIKNSDLKAHGEQTMTNVIELSLNTGAVFIQQKLGREKFIEYVKKFGFGKKTGIELFGEESGDLENIIHPRSNAKLIECANASFGQGISVTPIQILTAFTAIANGGKMIKPHIVKAIIHSDGTKEVIEPQVIGEPISAQAASRVTAMMVSATKKGYSQKAAVDGYLIAGKTGTAEASWVYFGQNKPGYSGMNVQSFINFAPAFNPEYILFLKMDAPTRGPRFSADSLAPVAKEINFFLLNYFGIPPTK